MGEEKNDKITGLVSSYSGFIAASLNRLYLTFQNGEPKDKFRAVKEFIPFLPNEVKVKVNPMIEAADKRIYAIKTSTSRREDHFDQSKRRAILLWEEYDSSAREILDTTTSILDNRGYMETSFHRVEHKDFQTFDDKEKTE